MRMSNPIFEIVPQIVAVVVSLAASLLAAYAIYLKTNQSQIDSKILKCGQNIASCISRFEPAKTPYRLDHNKLFWEYKNEFPKLSKIQLLNRIGQDLSFCRIGDNDSHGLFLKRFKASDYEIYAGDGLPYRGRLQLWLITQYYSLMDPASREVIIFPVHSDEVQEKYYGAQKKQLFPHGIVGVKKWLFEYKIIYNSLIYLFQNSYKEDYDKYKEEVNKNGEKEDIDYGEYVENLEKIIGDINKEVNEVESLVMYRNTLSLTKALPNINWIITSGILLVVVGILAPLVGSIFFSAKSLSSICVSLSVLFAVCLVVLTFLLVIVHGLSLSRGGHKDKVYAKIISKSIDKKASNRIIKHEVLNINDFIVNEKLYGVDGEMLAKLIAYRDAAISSNICMDNSVVSLLNKLGRDEVLSKYRGAYRNEDGVYRINLVDFMNDKKYAELMKNIEGKKVKWIIINVAMEKSGREYSFSLPENAKDLNWLTARLDETRETMAKSVDIKACFSSLDTTLSFKRKLIDYLDLVSRENNN